MKMQVFLSIKYHEDNRNRPLVEAIAAALAQHGHDLVCVVRDVEEWGRYRFSSNELMARTFELIRSSQAVLVELSEKGVGVGIEAGYAHARGIPVIVAARTGSDISETLRGIAAAVCLYDRPDQLGSLFSSAAAAAAPADQTSPGEASNASTSALTKP